MSLRVTEPSIWFISVDAVGFARTLTLAFSDLFALLVSAVDVVALVIAVVPAVVLPVLFAVLVAAATRDWNRTPRRQHPSKRQRR